MQLDATANVPGTFIYTPAAGTVLGAGNDQTLSVSFTPTDTTDYTTDAATASIRVLPTPTPPPGNIPPLVSVASVSPVFGRRKTVIAVIVRFSGPVFAAQAESVAEYRLAIAGKKGSFDAKNAKVIALKSAVYNSATFTVTLTPVKKFPLKKPVEVRVQGQAPSGLHDSFGRLISGDPNGIVSGNANAILSRGSVRILARAAVARLHSATVAVLRPFHRSQSHAAIVGPRSRHIERP